MSVQLQRMGWTNDNPPALNDTNLEQQENNVQQAITEVENIINETVVTGNKSIKLGDMLLQWGIISDVTVPATSYSSITVTFDEPYVNAPDVFIQPKGNYNIIGQVGGSTRTQTIINVRSVDGAKREGRTYSWLAIGNWK